jgi:hypothetical protein
MSKTDESNKIWVTVSETINIGNYESVKVDVGFSEDYNKAQNPIELLSTRIDTLQTMLEKKAKKIRKKRK